jgi:hypothetical protein
MVDPFTDPKIKPVRELAARIVSHAQGAGVNFAGLYLAVTMVRNWLQDSQPELAEAFTKIDAAIDSRRNRARS